MTPAEGSRLVLAAARVLFVNGQATDETVDAGERLASSVSLRAAILPRWGELQLQGGSSSAPTLSQLVVADPSGVNMTRVASAMGAIENIGGGRLPMSSAIDAISTISRLPPAPTWQFSLAAAAGAVSLAVIFGVRHQPAAALIFMSAAAGALLRRGLARVSENLFLQPFAAALLAGLVGALAV